MMTDQNYPNDVPLHRMRISLPPGTDDFPEGLKALMAFSIAKARLEEMIQEQIRINNLNFHLDFEAQIDD